MLLNLSSKLSFPCITKALGLKCKKDRGPSFGNYELQIFSPLNGKEKCWSYVNHPAYKIPKVNGDVNQLTNEICDNDGRGS